MEDDQTRAAHQMFLRYRGDLGGMRFNEELAAYKRFRVRPEQEREWASEREEWLATQIRRTSDRVAFLLSIEELIHWINRYDDGTFLTDVLDSLRERSDMLDSLGRLIVAELWLLVIRGGRHKPWEDRILPVTKHLIQTVLDGPIQVHPDPIPLVDSSALDPTTIRQRAERDLVQYRSFADSSPPAAARLQLPRRRRSSSGRNDHGKGIV